MLPQKRTAPLCVAGVAIFINARLPELRRVRTAVRIVAIGADDLALSQRHMGGAHDLRLTLQMALTANFDLRASYAEWRYLGQFRELLAAGLLHQRVTVDASQTAARVRARLPVSLNAALVATETGLILCFRRLAGAFAKSNQPTHSPAAARCDVIAAGTMAILARSFFGLVARIVQEYFPHQRGGKFFELRRVTSLTNFVADISGRGRGRGGFRCITFRRPDP